jgi:hypothetical protein
MWLKKKEITGRTGRFIQMDLQLETTSFGMIVMVSYLYGAKDLKYNIFVRTPRSLKH